MHNNSLDKKTYTKKLRNGILIDVIPEDHIDQQLFWYGSYEKDVADCIETLCKPNSIMFDIGANIGYFTLIAATKARKGAVYAFEPSESLFARLTSNITQNQLKNVNCFRHAVGERSGPATLYLSTSENTGMSSLTKPANFSGKTATVQMLRLDDFVVAHKINHIDIIKLDIEGSELEALKGMTDCLKRFQPYLIIELNPVTLQRAGLTPIDVLDFMHLHQYKAFNTADLKDFHGEIDEETNLLFAKHQVTRS